MRESGSADWASHLGDRTRERDYREFFTGEVGQLGIGPAVAAYIPTLIPASPAAHCTLHAAGLRRDTERCGGSRAALGYWSQSISSSARRPAPSRLPKIPAEVLIGLRPIEALHHVEPELDLLWHFMRAVARKPEFQGVVDRLRIGPDAFDRVRAASLALYAGTMDFCALHALTGSHWLRVAWPALPEPELALRYFWQAIAALYPKIGFPDLPSAEQLDAVAQRAHARLAGDQGRRCKERRRARHQPGVLRFEEWKFYGDPLYQFVAARRVRLMA